MYSLKQVLYIQHITRITVACCRFEPEEASFDSFLLNQNWPDYQRAIAVSVFEYLLEWTFFSEWKLGYFARSVSTMGLLMVLAGQVIRSLGMATAGGSFTHRIAESRRSNHVLVSNGIFTMLRHPAYAGWFYWSVGSQLMLLNPICTVLYTYVSWKFFSDRIPYEESMLCQMFPDYPAYARSVPIGIPGIQGHISVQRPTTPRFQRLSSSKE
jgi:protein-S-isoprenylcysteine O-methyltransferase